MCSTPKLRFLAALLGLLVSSSCLSAVSTVSAEPTRTALIIGNSQYLNAPLRNPENDAKDLAETLKTLDFNVMLHIDANQRQMEQAIDQFEDELKKRSGIGLFYYAGHGIQSQGTNYLLPINNAIERERDLRYDAVDVGRIISAMEFANNDLNIIILDACRNNPLTRSFRSSARGLARLNNTPKGLLIAYSTSPGEVALDGDGRNSPYAKSLIQAMQTKNQHILLTFQAVANAVQSDTKGAQVPWISSSLTRNFFFSKTKESQPFSTATNSSETSAATNSAETSTPKQSTSPPLASEPKPQLATIETIEQPYQLPQGQYHWKIHQDALTDTSLGPKLVMIPKGEFLMGSDEATKHEKPEHSVNIGRPFWVSIHEISFQQYELFSKHTHRRLPQAKWGREQQPMINVSWQDAYAYTLWLSEQTGHNYRLPSESEWEYFARATTTARYYWGDELAQCSALPLSRIDKARNFQKNDIHQCAQTLKQKQRIQANCRHCFSWIKAGKTFPVNSYQPNALGLFNTLGNVAEYTQDCWRPNYYGAPADHLAYERGDCLQRVIRGGHWNSAHNEIQVTSRQPVEIHHTSDQIGFRVVRED